MANPAARVELPLSQDELHQARLFDHQPLKSVVLWSVGTPGIRHWRTGFVFADPLPTVVSNTTQGPPPPPSSTVVSKRVHPGIYGGISIDMFQPIAHQYHVPVVDGTDNLYGRLSITPRLKDLLFSRSASLFPCSVNFKVPVTVKDVLDLILIEGRQYYKFSTKGSGCLYWQLQLLEAFVARGWIDRANLDAANAQIAGLATKAGSGVPYPPVVGVFYQPPQ